MGSQGSSVRGVGFFGAGRVSRDHVYAATRLPDLKLVGVAEPDEERRTLFAQRHGCDGYADHRDLLAREDVDLVLVGLPHYLHAPLTIDALNAGKHVMVEKPMAMTVEECEAMIEAADRNGVRLMVGHTQHFFPSNIAAKDLIDRGEIGEIVLATQTWSKPFGLAGRPPWLLDRSTGGGMWLMNGAHMLDCLLWFVGSEVVAVKGSVTSKIVQQEADDSIIALLEFANGVYATVVHSGSKRPVQPPPEQWLIGETTGTEGAVRTVPYQGEAWLNTEGDYEPVDLGDDGSRAAEVAAFLQATDPATAPSSGAEVPRSAVEEMAGVASEVAAFIGAIESGAEPPVSNAHALAVMEAMLAVEESSRTGREVRLR